MTSNYELVLMDILWFSIGNNQIQFMNGATFGNLYSLVKVDLLQNICINNTFTGDEALMKIVKISTQNCGFCEVATDLTNCEILEEFKRTGRRVFELFQNQIDENQQIKLELASLKKVLIDLLKRDGISNTTLND